MQSENNGNGVRMAGTHIERCTTPWCYFSDNSQEKIPYCCAYTSIFHLNFYLALNRTSLMQRSSQWFIGINISRTSSKFNSLPPLFLHPILRSTLRLRPFLISSLSFCGHSATTITINNSTSSSSFDSHQPWTSLRPVASVSARTFRQSPHKDLFCNPFHASLHSTYYPSLGPNC